MKKIYFLLFALAILGIASKSTAQSRIVVQNGSSTSFFTDLPTAVLTANNGDTVYIPGGIWPGDLVISKNIHIFGVGHNPDSTTLTSICNIQGNIYLQTGDCSNSTFTGFYASGSLYDNAIDSIKNVTITRCNFNGLYLQAHSYFWYLFENVITGIIVPSGASNFIFSNNIIEASYPSYGYLAFTFNLFKNNIFLSSYDCPDWCYYSLSGEQNTFENNIFLGVSDNLDLVGTSVFNNNIFVEDITFPLGTNPGNYNLVNQPMSDIFVTPQTDYTFYYNHDYHLKAGNPGIHAGTDGEDIGIYGGMFPWKAGSLPINPHILTKSISSVTRTPDGALQVKVKVETQSH